MAKDTSRVALVTGASRGLGAAIAARLAGAGMRVALVARSADALVQQVEALRAQGLDAHAMCVDVTDAKAAEAAVGAFVAAHGPVDILVNNAGGNVRRAALDYSLQEFDALLALGLRAPFHWSCLVAKGMQRRGWGRIVNIGSVAGLTALPTGAPYAAAKAGVAMLTRSLAREWGPKGLTVNCIAPWYVPTPLTEGVLSDAGFRAAVLHCTPGGRLGTPADVAAAVAFLCSEDAGWINGVCLPLDGGFTAASFHP